MGDYTLKSYNLDEATLLQPLKNDLGLEAVGLMRSRRRFLSASREPAQYSWETMRSR